MTVNCVNLGFRADGLNLSGNTVLLFLPLAHLFGLAVICNSVYFAKSIIIMPRFDLQKFLEYIVSYKVWLFIYICLNYKIILSKYAISGSSM